MTLRYAVWLWFIVYIPFIHCLTIDYVWLYKTLLDTVWLCMTLYDSEWLCWNQFHLYDSFFLGVVSTSMRMHGSMQRATINIFQLISWMNIELFCYWTMKHILWQHYDWCLTVNYFKIIGMVTHFLLTLFWTGWGDYLVIQSRNYRTLTNIENKPDDKKPTQKKTTQKAPTQLIDKLGLNWAKLSHQLGLGCSFIKICCIIEIILASMTATNH